MRPCQLLTTFAMTSVVAASPRCSDFPPSMVEFSSKFKQPKPPLIKSEYSASFVQHKWNTDLSHITTGYIENLPSKSLVRVGEAYHGQVAWSLFDHSNVTKSGLVDNKLTSYDATSNSTSWRGYVNSNFPIFQKNILVHAGAVFGGLVQRQFMPSPVAAWNMMYQDIIPVTVYVDECNVIVGYDYFSPELRTRVVMEFFNIEAN